MESTYNKYADAIKTAGPRLVELILQRAEHDRDIDFDDFLNLCRMAYPENDGGIL